MSVANVPRRTPGPAHLRLAALALFTYGMGLGFLGILIAREALNAPTAGHAIAAAAAGALLAALPGPRISKRGPPGRSTRAYLAACGIASAVGLVAVSLDRIPRDWPGTEFATLLLIGIAAGGSLRLSVALALPLLPSRRANSLTALAGASFGLGAMAASLGSAAASAEMIALCAAIVPAVLAGMAVRAGRLRFPDSLGDLIWKSDPAGAGPRSRLLAVGLLLEIAACGIAACWLSVYFSRGVGLSGGVSAAGSAAFWLALAAGWAAGVRMPRVRHDLRTLFVPLVLSAAGASALLWAVWPLAAWAGGVLLGLGLGVLFPLTLRLIHWPATLDRGLWIVRSMHLSLAVALLLCWLTGALSYMGESQAVVWSILACVAGAVTVIFLLVMDYRFSGEAAVV